MIQKEIKESVIDLKSSIDTLPQKLDQRYASKDTEIALKRLNWIVINGFICWSIIRDNFTNKIIWITSNQKIE